MAKPPPKTTPAASRHMKRADGKAQTSISMREDLLDQARHAAEAEGRSLSNWIEQMLKEKFTPAPAPPPPPPASAATAAKKTTPPPRSAPRGKKRA
jgi:hypothetical protein